MAYLPPTNAAAANQRGRLNTAVRALFVLSSNQVSSRSIGAAFVDQVEPSTPEGLDLFLGVCGEGSSARWPEIVITQKYEDASGTFHPNFLMVPETSILFIGAGERLLAYNVERREKVFEDRTDYGFWSWRRQEDYVLISAELEFGVRRKTGEKHWSTFVEPPRRMSNWISSDN